MSKKETASGFTPFYITTTLPYVNSDPHIGFAMEIIRADVVARFKKEQGFEVFFNTGTDEHGQKIAIGAEKVGLEIQKYVDEYAEKFRNLKDVLGLSLDVHFVRTTDAHHVSSAQAFWNVVKERGFIYKKNYTTKYCVGCELEKTDSELVNGRCVLHPTQELELIEEENYFFKFSAFQEKLLKLYTDRPDFVIPDFRFNEIKAFVSRGLEDFSISRLKSKMPWGVPVPDDEGHVMYVWFDALVSYISTLGWPEDSQNFEKFWRHGTPTQYCGKDNLRQQSAMWQAMLMASGLPSSHQIIINGFITSGGQKISKSLGNGIDPVTIVNEYGTDALRYYVIRELSPFEDSDFTMEKFMEAYNANLANGIGNLVSRVMRMATANGVIYTPCSDGENGLREEVEKFVSKYEMNKALDVVFTKISELDTFIQHEQPFKTIKTDVEKGKTQISELLSGLYQIGQALQAFLPETSQKILDCIHQNKMPEKPLFLRKD